MCATHQHQAEIRRWTARAELRVIDPEAQEEALEIRKEKLLRAKFLAHEAVEVFFRSLLGATQAIWGSVNDADNAEDRKAA